MVETAAYLTDHVLLRLPVRQWVLSVAKRLRYFMQRDGVVRSMVLCIFLRVIEQSLATGLTRLLWLCGMKPVEIELPGTCRSWWSA